MKVLLAEDESIPRRVLTAALAGWGYEVQAVADGLEAWQGLQGPDAARLAILDWQMPGLDGAEVCRRLRGQAAVEPTYVILLTARSGKDDVVAGLDAGANDYVTKPFDRAELHARLRVGCQVVALQRSLAARVRELEEALAQVKQLQGLLPICCYCKKIRDDQNYWQQVDGYLAAHSDVRFSHGICPECWKRVLRPQLQAMGQDPPEEPPS